MSNQPVIALGPMPEGPSDIQKDYDKHNVHHEDHFFADEVKIGDQTIFTIPLEHQFDDRPVK